MNRRAGRRRGVDGRQAIEPFPALLLRDRAVRLVGLLAEGGGVALPDGLAQQAQRHAVGGDGEGGVDEQALLMEGGQRAEAGGGRMMGVVEQGGVVDGQHQGQLADPVTGGLDMAGEDGRRRTGSVSVEAIGGLEAGGVGAGIGQGSAGAIAQGGRQVDQPPGAAGIAQLGRRELCHRPLGLVLAPTHEPALSSEWAASAARL